MRLPRVPITLPLIIIGIGVGLRLYHYVMNRSLWLDEAKLALHIVGKSFSELAQPLVEGLQVAPLGFLFVQKTFVLAFGNSEFALRLFPLICGTLAMAFFRNLAKVHVRKGAMIIALGLFAVSPKLIYYSSEVKQYASDALITIILYLVTAYVQSRGLNLLRSLLYIVAGAVAVLFSHPSVFILAGVGTTLGALAIHSGDRSTFLRTLLIASIWFSVFLFSHFSPLSQLRDNPLLADFWRDGFMPFPPSSLSDFQWFIDTFLGIFKDSPLMLFLPGIGLLAFIIGAHSLFKERRTSFFMLLLPILFSLLASAFHKYPFKGRLLLFLVPCFLLFIAEGAAVLREKSRNGLHIFGNAFILLLFLMPTLYGINRVIHAQVGEEIREVIKYVVEHKKDGDLIYVYYGARPAFEYYASRYGISKNDFYGGIYSRSDWDNYIHDINRSRGSNRVWLIFSHVPDWDCMDEQEFYIRHLNTIGRKLDNIKAPGASAYLYDLHTPGLYEAS